MTGRRVPIRALAAALPMAVLVAGAVTSPAAAGGTADEIPLRLLDVTDLHGQLRPDGVAPVTNPDGSKTTVGGLAYLSTHLDKLRRGHPESITFSTGDNFTGWGKPSFWLRGEPIVDFLNHENVQLSTVGNHELDTRPEWFTQHMVRGNCGGPYGPAGVKSCFPDSTGHRYHGTDFPYSSANIVDRKTGKPIVPPYIVETVRGAHGKSTKIGFINLTVTDTVDNLRTILSFNPSLEALPEVKTANHYAKVLQNKGVEAIVLSVHNGGVPEPGTPYDGCSDIESSPQWGMGVEIAKRVSPAIDAVFTGHQHKLFNCTVTDPAGNPRPVMEAGAYGQAIAMMDLAIDAQSGDVLRKRTVAHNVPNSHDVAPDPAVKQLVDHWWNFYDQYEKTTVGKVTGDITSVRNAAGESITGNAMADMELWEGQKQKHDPADLALVKQLFLPPDLHYKPGASPADRQGKVLFGEVAGMPGGTSQPIVNADLTGAQIKQVLEEQWSADADDTETFAPLAVSHNLSYSYDSTKPIGHRVDMSSIRLGGQAIEPSVTYRVAGTVTFFKGNVYDQAADYPTAHKATNPYRLEQDRFAWIDWLRGNEVTTPPDLGRTEDTGLEPVDVDGTAYLSDLPWVSATSGWRRVQRDSEVGGHPMSVADKSYPKGLGVASPSDITYYLGGRCTELSSVIGQDDYVKSHPKGATSVFQVFLDGEKVFDSDLMKRDMSKKVHADLTEASTLVLRVTDGGDGTYNDRADWANAKISCG